MLDETLLLEYRFLGLDRCQEYIDLSGHLDEVTKDLEAYFSWQTAT
jgi:hypothetical protein